jgi:2-isopropylmalate synthase
MTDDRRVYLFDTTLRDGAQTQGVDFSVADKQAIAHALDQLGIDYVEGGWPGANPTDDAFFRDSPKFRHAIFTAFGMTRRSGRSASNDPGLTALLSSGAKAICLVGKSWDFQVDVALGIPRSENVDMIGSSIGHLVSEGREALFDAEHFFDGYKANPVYAMDCLKAAAEGGARWLVLCDTNGGALPDEIERIVGKVTEVIPGARIAIHCHDDTGNAVANSLAAVRAGARQVQGTMNGLGERCGNANLTAILPTLVLKMGFKTGADADRMTLLTQTARLVDERLNRSPNRHAAYVGESAFAHKGGLHVAAIEKDPTTYEHVPPESVGNARKILVSDQAGRANVLSRLRALGIEPPSDPAKIAALVELVKQREFEGYAYDGADASFALLAQRAFGIASQMFRVMSFRVIDERRWDGGGDPHMVSEATIRVEVNGDHVMTVAEGNGPVNALDSALRKALAPSYPVLEDIKLVDYKVRILTPNAGTRAVTRVIIDSVDAAGNRWSTVGVSANVIDASFMALHDALSYRLTRDLVAV